MGSDFFFKFKEERFFLQGMFFFLPQLLFSDLFGYKFFKN